MLDEIQECWFCPVDVVENDDERPIVGRVFKELSEGPCDPIRRCSELLLSDQAAQVSVKLRDPAGAAAVDG